MFGAATKHYEYFILWLNQSLCQLFAFVEYFHHFMTKSKIQCDSDKGQIVPQGGEVLKLPDFEEKNSEIANRFQQMVTKL